jgi:sulfoxide reductase catalytic subunit YedY
MAQLVELAKPLSSATYVRMETFLDTSVAPGQRQRWCFGTPGPTSKD